jgi:hypothetical protein
MKKNITQHDLIRFVYEKELQLNSFQIQNALSQQKELFQEERRLQMVKELISDSALCPKISTLKKILAYSKSLRT